MTLFTVAVRTKNESKTTCDSNVIVSNDLKHDKKSVAVFIHKVLKDLVKKKYPHISKACIFSDGPSSQFKNRYLANFLHTLQAQFMDIKWNYFATSHVKGIVDGIGGSVKRMVWKAMSTRKVKIVKDANVASAFDKSVTISYIPSEEREITAIFIILKRFFSKAPKICGISKFHCLEPQNGSSIYQSTWV